jgi:hypothetical protein
MHAEFLVVLISGLLSVIAGGVASTDLARKLVYRMLKKELPKKSNFQHGTTIWAGSAGTQMPLTVL